MSPSPAPLVLCAMFLSTAAMQPAVSASIQRMSAGVTKCQVGRRTWVRRMSPAVKARSTWWSVTPGARKPSAHFAPG